MRQSLLGGLLGGRFWLIASIKHNFKVLDIKVGTL